MFLFLLGVIISVVIYYKLIKPCSYWREKGIAYVSSWPVVGSLWKVVLRKKSLMETTVDIYNQFPNEQYVGYMQFTRNYLLLRDLDIIKQVCVEEFSHFHDRTSIVESKTDPIFSKSLISLKGEQWRDMRATLSPAFTSNKMKNMYGLMAECAETLVNHFQNDVEVDVKELFSKFANDVIANTAFGIHIDSVEDPQNEFFKMGSDLSASTTCKTLKLILNQTAKPVADLFGVQIFPKHITTFFKTIIMENIAKRETEGIVRHDFIHLLMEAKKGKLKPEDTKEEEIGFAAVEEAEPDPTTQQVALTDDHVIAQTILFFFAGFETVSSTASFMSYELAINPDIQKKLHEEIDAVYQKHQHKLPYESLVSMKYLDQVLSETLRLWPPGFQTDRLCVKNFLVQPATPEEKPFMIEKGVTVMIPIAALHLDPQYYPEPTRFDPERFSDTNKSKIVPGTYLPFGIGPRNCIGSRFAILELKILFYHLLSKFEIVPIDKTEIPLKLSKINLRLATDGGMWLGLKLRRNPS